MDTMQPPRENLSSRGTHHLSAVPAPRMLSREALTLVLWRQRAYADRTGAPFVFVRVRLAGPERLAARGAQREMLARFACGLCRASDVAGWHGEKGDEVGVLLPDATPRGALRVVRELEAGLRARAVAEEESPELVCELFVYPGARYAPVVDWAVGNLDAERA